MLDNDEDEDKKKSKPFSPSLFEAVFWFGLMLAIVHTEVADQPRRSKNELRTVSPHQH